MDKGFTPRVAVPLEEMSEEKGSLLMYAVVVLSLIVAINAIIFILWKCKAKEKVHSTKQDGASNGDNGGIDNPAIVLSEMS